MASDTLGGIVWSKFFKEVEKHHKAEEGFNADIEWEFITAWLETFED
jgi:hypothetical protein